MTSWCVKNKTTPVSKKSIIVANATLRPFAAKYLCDDSCVAKNAGRLSSWVSLGYFAVNLSGGQRKVY